MIRAIKIARYTRNVIGKSNKEVKSPLCTILKLSEGRARVSEREIILNGW